MRGCRPRALSNMASRGMLTGCPLATLGDEPPQLGILQHWQLTLYGSMWSPADIRERQR